MSKILIKHRTDRNAGLSIGTEVAPGIREIEAEQIEAARSHGWEVHVEPVERVEPESERKRTTMEEAIASAAKGMLPGGEYENREEYVVNGIAGAYKAAKKDVKAKLLAAFEAEKAAAASASSAASGG